MSNYLNKNTVFLLGAGFSKAVAQAMPLIRDIPWLLEKITPEVYREFITPDFNDDFELWLSAMASGTLGEDPSRKTRRTEAFHAVLINLSRVLLNRMNCSFRESQWTDEIDSDAWLHRLFRFWDNHQSTILTFNYDALIEHRYFAFRNPRHFRNHSPPPHYPHILTPFPHDSGNQRVPDFNKPQFQLFKLHGSINWWRRFPPNDDDQTVYFWDRPMGKWKRADKNNPETPAHIDATAVDFDLVPVAHHFLPFIVPPVAIKDSFYRVDLLESIWENAAKKMEQASAMVVMGYSFPKSDQSAIAFFQKLNREARVLIIDKCPLVSDRARKIFNPLGIPVEQAPTSDFAMTDFVNSVLPSP